MNTALEFINTSPVFHIATVDGTKARVRPFGFIMKRNNTLYFCTNKTKDVYKQLKQSPDIEISDMGSNSTWLRIRGRIAFDETREAKVKAFEHMPDLLKIYPKGADDELVCDLLLYRGSSHIILFQREAEEYPAFLAIG